MGAAAMNAVNHDRWVDHLVSKRPCLSCPLCGSEVPVAPHARGRPWSEAQDWWLLRMKAAGAPAKMLARAFGCLARNTIEDRLKVLRKRDLSLTASVGKRTMDNTSVKSETRP